MPDGCANVEGWKPGRGEAGKPTGIRLCRFLGSPEVEMLSPRVAAALAAFPFEPNDVSCSCTRGVSG